VLMKALLICPSAAPALRPLSEAAPIATMPLLGQGLVEYWLSHLACSGTKEVTILSHDRTGELETLVENGRRWGLKAQLIEESRELTPAQARSTYEKYLEANSPTEAVAVMDHFPGQRTPLFTTYQQFFDGLLEWIPKAKTPDRVGVIEIRPGVWTGLNCNLSADVELQPPCWIGKNVFIGPHTVIGPGAIIEDGSFIERASSITNSQIGPHTFVGQCSEICRSLALGDTLLNLQTGLATKVPDKFVLCALRQPRLQDEHGWFSRLAEICCRNKAEAQLLWKHLLINRGS
jgi:NDP-sugar pyrophosphorylase family protein